MKIAIFSSLYFPYETGGAEVSTRLLAEALQREGHEVFVVTTGPKDEIGEVGRIRVYYMASRNLYWMSHAKDKPSWMKPLWHWVDRSDSKMASAIGPIFETEDPDIVHTHTLSGLSVAVWKLAARKHIPIVHTIRDYYLMCPKTSMFRRNKSCRTICGDCKIFSSTKKKYSENVRAVVGISQFVLDRHTKAGYFSKSAIRQVIYNPLESAGLVSDRKPGPIRFGYVGSLSPHKGAELMLSAFQEMPDVPLAVYGHGFIPAYDAEIKRKYALPNIHFMGRDAPGNIYANMDVLIVPSLWDEPFGRVVIEANSYGVPVIASRVGGIPEIVQDGINGILYEANSAGSLKEAINRFVLTPGRLDPFSEAARKSAGFYEIKAHARRYMEIYDDVLSNA